MHFYEVKQSKHEGCSDIFFVFNINVNSSAVETTLMSAVGEATQCESVNVLLLHVMCFLKQYTKSQLSKDEDDTF